MASDRATLNVAERTEFGSRIDPPPAPRAAWSPASSTAAAAEARAFQVAERDVRNVLATARALIDLEIDGGTADAGGRSRSSSAIRSAAT